MWRLRGIEADDAFYFYNEVCDKREKGKWGGSGEEEGGCLCGGLYNRNFTKSMHFFETGFINCLALKFEHKELRLDITAQKCRCRNLSKYLLIFFILYSYIILCKKYIQ